MTSFNVRVFLSAVLFFCGSCSLAFAQDFGKVFSTPQERTFLDRQREELLLEMSEEERLELLSQSVDEQVALELSPRLVHMGGVVRKPDGNHTVWLNGVAVRSQDLPANVSLEFERSLGILKIRTFDNIYVVRPGQTLDADTGEVREDYELSIEEIESVRTSVASRAELVRAGSNNTRTLADAADSSEVSDVEERDAEELISDIVEVLQLMQQARDLQGTLQ